MGKLDPSSPDGRHLSVVLIRSRFNAKITQRLLNGALAALRRAGVAEDRVEMLEVPGAVELPLAADLALARGGIDAVVCLGAIIRGETGHYDLVCRMTADGIRQVTLERKVPVAFGVLTCETMEQALARSGSGDANRGADAARAALEMANLSRRLKQPPAAAKRTRKPTPKKKKQ